MTRAPARGSGSELCTQCGLCCNGVLHDRADAEHGERDAIEQLGLAIEASDNRLHFQLPCSRLEGTVCSVYAHRPSACRHYECGLLQRYNTGKVSLEHALGLVAQAGKLIAEVRRAVPVGQSLRGAREEWRSKLRNSTAEDADTPEGHMALKRHLSITALNLFLDRNFRTDGEAKTTVMK